MKVKSRLQYQFRVGNGMTIEPGKEYELPDDIARHLLNAKMVRKIKDAKPKEKLETSPKKKGGRK